MNLNFSPALQKIVDEHGQNLQQPYPPRAHREANAVLSALERKAGHKPTFCPERGITELTSQVSLVAKKLLA